MSSVDDPQGQASVAACFLCQNASAAPTSNCNKLENNLKVIFLLKELLGISFDLCANYLQKYGDPSSWIYLCPECQEVISEGQQLFQKIKQLEDELQNIKTKVECQAKVKSEYDANQAEQEIRQDFMEISNNTEYYDDEDDQEHEESQAMMEFEINPEENQSSNITVKIETKHILENLYPDEEVNKRQKNQRQIKFVLKKMPQKIKQESIMNEKDMDRNYSPENSDSSSSDDESDPTSGHKNDKSVENNSQIFSIAMNLLKNKPAPPTPLKQKEKPEKGEFPCLHESCEKILTKREYFEDHYRSLHVPRVAVTCAGCNKTFQLKCKYKFHLEDATDDICLKASVKCSLCDVRGSSQEALNIHFKFNHMPLEIPERKPNRLPCIEPTCSQTFSKLLFLNRHMNRFHPNIQLPPEDNKEEKEQAVGFPCPEKSCGKRFSLRYLEYHFRKIHLPPDVLICSGCKERIPDHIKFLKHLETNENCAKSALECPQCDVRAQNEETLQVHINIHHVLCNLHLPYKCHVCDKEFKHNSGLTVHMKEHDITDRLAFICDKCGAGFPLEASLRLHIRKSHGPKGSFNCRFCSKVFEKRLNRRQHERLHKDGNPHECTVCGKCFKIKKYLQSHMQTHDPDRKLKYKSYKPDKPKHTKGTGTNQRVKVTPSSSTNETHSQDITNSNAAMQEEG